MTGGGTIWTGVIFSDPMALANVERRKSQTRRVIRPGHESRDDCPFGGPGDKLYQRETWALVNDGGFAVEASTLQYRCDGVQRLLWPDDHRTLWDRDTNPSHPSLMPRPGWRSARFMPRWAARVVMTVSSTRRERLQEITTADAIAEGIPQLAAEAVHLGLLDASVEGYAWDNQTSVENYSVLWNDLHAADGEAWHDNPMVWVVEYATEVLQGRVDPAYP